VKSTQKLLAAVATLLLTSATPAPTVIPLPTDNSEGEALIIPSDSPVKFRRWKQYDMADFDGRFVLTGTFVYGCAIDCEQPKENDRFYRMDFTPDPNLVRRLPRWKMRSEVPDIVITNERAFIRAVVSPQVYVGLHNGKISDVRGRASILIDHFEAGIECDSPELIARFVRVVGKPKMSAATPDGNPGCG
jgi:hypothetical protein